MTITNPFNVRLLSMHTHDERSWDDPDVTEDERIMLEIVTLVARHCGGSEAHWPDILGKYAFVTTDWLGTDNPSVDFMWEEGEWEWAYDIGMTEQYREGGDLYNLLEEHGKYIECVNSFGISLADRY